MMRFAGRLAAELRDNGVNVLRNKAVALSKGNDRLWFVGLGDIWADDFKPHRAFKNVSESEPVIALSHNPETVELAAQSSHRYRAKRTYARRRTGCKEGRRQT